MQLSVVIPVCNEVKNIGIIYNSLSETLKATNLDYEIIFVDDGSGDGTADSLLDLQSKDSTVKVLSFIKNRGQGYALGRGIEEARGEIIITMDGDLQNDPKDIPRLLDKIGEGYDVVSGWRRQRKDTFLTRVLPSIIANRIISIITGLRLHDYGCSLKAYRKRVAKALPPFGDFHRYAPAFSLLNGSRVAEIEVNHHPRIFGCSKYGIGRVWKVAWEIVRLYFILRRANKAGLRP